MTLPVLGYHAGRGDVVLDVDQLLGTRLLVQGVSGSGKSTAIRGLLEQTHGRVQHLVIDREGEFATLRGKYPYVLAGKDGDLPTDLRTAKLLIRRVMELGASAIVDLSDLRIPDQREWVRRAFDELVHLPRELWHPLLVILDEGHIFAPERGSGESVATQAVIDVATLGRKRGYCLVVATQRLSKLHKDCAAELLNKFIGYTDDVDLQRAGDQLGMTKEQRATLKTLEWGQFFVYGPAVSKRPVLVKAPTPATTAPPRGQARPPAPPPPAEVKRLLAHLQDLPQQAEEEVRTVADLERRNHELQRRVRLLEKGAPAAAPVTKVQEVIKRVEVPVLKDAQLKRLEGVSGRLMQFGDRVAVLGQDVVSVGREITASLAKLQQPSNGQGRSAPPPRQAAPRPGPRFGDLLPVRQAAKSPRAPVEEGEVQLKAGARSMLQAIAYMHPRPLTRTEVGLLAGVTPTGGTFSDYLSKLRVAGYIAEDGGIVEITGAGLAAAEPADPARYSTATLVELWGKTLKAGARAMLNALVDCYPEALERSDLGSRAMVAATGGTFSDYLSKLRTVGLIEEPGRRVKASETLFLEGAAR